MSFSVNSINSISASFTTTQNVMDSSKRIANTEFVSNSIELHKHAIGAHASLEILHGSEETVASELNRLSSSISGGVMHRLTDTGSGISLIKNESGILEKLINGTKIELTKIESGGIRIDVSGSDVTQTQLDLINSLSGGEASQYYAGNNTYKSFDSSVSSSSLSNKFSDASSSWNISINNILNWNVSESSVVSILSESLMSLNGGVVEISRSVIELKSDISTISSSFLFESASTSTRITSVEEKIIDISSSLNQLSSSVLQVTASTLQISSSIANEISQSNFTISILSGSVSDRLHIEEEKSTQFSSSINDIEITQSGIINDVFKLSSSLFQSGAVSGHNALSNLQGGAVGEYYHLDHAELEFFGTLPSTISTLTSNVEEVDTNFVSITYNPVGIGAGRGLYSGLMSETAPTQASTGLATWVNQGAASVADTLIGLQVTNPTTGADDNIRGLVMPVPATPYTLTALLELASISGNYPSALLGWSDSGSTKMHIAILCGDGRSGLISPTTYSGWTLSGAPTFTRDGRRCWLRFADDGTTVSVQWSISGVYWHTLYSAAKASSHLGATGYNRLFFGASSSGITGVATLLSWSIS